jgi:CRISPR-associated exonuclease Cas4
VIDLVAVGVALAGVGSVVLGGVALRRRAAERRLGELVAIDAGRAATLRSRRYRLVGRPDELRRRRDGAVVPVELKRRPAPREAPFASHRLQVEAYCLLVEETFGRPPPFGVLRYRDREVVVPWDRSARREVLAALEAATAPYDGRAEPGEAKCAACRWSGGCDASWGPRRAGA